MIFLKIVAEEREKVRNRYPHLFGILVIWEGLIKL